MAEYTIYTRVYSERSAGKLCSAKKPTRNALTHSELLDEFLNHAIRENTKPTALISVSSRIIDTVKRAFDKCYTYGESPEDIWIAFVKIATVDESPTPVHVARHLVEEGRHEKPNVFYHEYNFEWIIPDNYLLHQVSLQTLIDRGLDWKKYLFADSYGDRVVSAEELREHITVDLLAQQARHNPGRYLLIFPISQNDKESL
ncbi:hypothetical protein HDV64DRAFT_153624 [Trichoderma sp. TUCIM 5745]